MNNFCLFYSFYINLQQYSQNNYGKVIVFDIVINHHLLEPELFKPIAQMLVNNSFRHGFIKYKYSLHLAENNKKIYLKWKMLIKFFKTMFLV